VHVGYRPNPRHSTLWTRSLKADILGRMTNSSAAVRKWSFWLVFTVWLATAIPIALFSLFTFELPLWPNFSAESTPEGISVWAVFAAWFYITPAVLVVIHRRSTRQAAS
jgi:hypothetical protein